MVRVELSEEQKLRLQKLTAALRSGEYTQALSRLHNVQGHCCLGVACDVYSKNTNQGEWSLSDSNQNGEIPYYTFIINGLGSSLTLPLEVVEWYGFKIPDPMLSVNGVHYAQDITNGDSIFCTAANDSGNFTFSDIADLLEKTYLN